MSSAQETTRVWVKRDRDYQAEERISFGLVDAKGRAIGYLIARYLETVTELTEDQTYGYTARPEELGVWYAAATWATRDGARYGASQRDLEARTPEELERLIAARAKGARARYAKAAAAR